MFRGWLAISGILLCFDPRKLGDLSLSLALGRLSSLVGGDLVDVALGGVDTSLNAMSKKSSMLSLVVKMMF